MYSESSKHEWVLDSKLEVELLEWPLSLTPLEFKFKNQYIVLLNMMIKKMRQAANSKHYLKKWTSNTEYKNDIYTQCVKRITDD